MKEIPVVLNPILMGFEARLLWLCFGLGRNTPLDCPEGGAAAALRSGTGSVCREPGVRLPPCAAGSCPDRELGPSSRWVPVGPGVRRHRKEPQPWHRTGSQLCRLTLCHMVLYETEGTDGFCFIRWLGGCEERTPGGPGHGAWYPVRAQ